METISPVDCTRTVSCALHLLLWGWRVDPYWSIHATVLLRWSQDKNGLMISLMGSGAKTSVMHMVESFFTSGSSSGIVVLMLAGLYGHSSLSRVRNSWPCIQCRRESADTPWSVICWIGLCVDIVPLTRFTAKVWNRLSWFSMYCRTQVLSVQKNDWSIGKLNSFQDVLSSLIAEQLIEKWTQLKLAPLWRTQQKLACLLTVGVCTWFPFALELVLTVSFGMDMNKGLFACHNDSIVLVDIFYKLSKVHTCLAYFVILWTILSKWYKKIQYKNEQNKSKAMETYLESG